MPGPLRFPIVASSKDEMMDWVHVMRGPRQKGSKRKRRGKEKAHNSSNGAGPAPPESPEKAPAAVAGDDSLDSTYSPPAWVRAFPFSGLGLVGAQLTRVDFRKRRDGSG